MRSISVGKASMASAALRTASLGGAAVGRVAGGFALVGAALLATMAVGAGSASAAVPDLDLGQGRLGAHLSHDETAALAGGPIPALVTMVIPPGRMGAGLQPDTMLWRDENGNVRASLRQVIAESARHPDGTVSLYLNLPGTHGGRILDVYQNWSD